MRIRNNIDWEIIIISRSNTIISILTIRNVWQTVRRISDEIVGVTGLKTNNSTFKETTTHKVLFKWPKDLSLKRLEMVYATWEGKSQN